MKVKFLDPGNKLPSSMLKLGYSPKVDLHLKVGEIYGVYGISIWRNVLHYLLFSTDEMSPSWLPADLFEIVDLRIPFDWYFRYLGENAPNELKILIGYKELVAEDQHYINLIELDRGAIRIFLDRKKEIDEES